MAKKAAREKDKRRLCGRCLILTSIIIGSGIGAYDFWISPVAWMSPPVQSGLYTSAAMLVIGSMLLKELGP